MTPKYPDITVELTGQDGNAFFILARVRKALSRNGVSKEEIDTFYEEATGGNYDHLLATTMKWVNVV